MGDLIPFVVTQVILAMLMVSCLWMAVMLFRAAWLNHFKFKTYRPAVISEGLLMLALGAEFTKRTVSTLTPVGSDLHTAMVRSGAIDDIVNLLLLISVSALFWTLALAYPNIRKKP